MFRWAHWNDLVWATGLITKTNSSLQKLYLGKKEGRKGGGGGEGKKKKTPKTVETMQNNIHIPYDVPSSEYLVKAQWL